MSGTLQQRQAALAARRAQLSAERLALTETRLRGIAGGSQTDPCLVTLSSGSERPLFCIHPAGGDVVCFGRLAEHLPGRPVLGVQSVGLDGEQPPMTSIAAMAAHYADAIERMPPRGPYLIAGWSLGAHVALELAQTLVERGQQIGLLALLDADADAGVAAQKTLVAEHAPDGLAPWLMGIAEYLERTLGRRVPLTLEQLLNTSPQAQLERFVAALSDGIPPAAPVPSVAQLRHILDVYQSNVRALAGHSPRVYAGRITLFSTDLPSGSSRGWAPWTTDTVEVVSVPGDHYSLLSEPHVQSLARALDAQIPGGQAG